MVGTLPPITVTAKRGPDINSDDLILIVNDQKISGWTDIRVTRGIERCPNDFDIRLTDLFPGEANAVVVQAGDTCELRMGKDLVLTGFVDHFSPSFDAKARAIAVAGRGKCQDLVDCAAIWPNSQISNSDVLATAQKLAEPYGIQVVVATGQDVGKTIPIFNFGLGETAFGLIETMCRYRALLAYELPSGALFLTRVSERRAASGLKEGVNVERAYAVFSQDQRFSEYVPFFNSVDHFSDVGKTDDNFLPAIIDPGVKRFRRKFVHIEAAPGEGPEGMTARAVWERNRRMGRSFQVRVETDSWRDASGKLYEPNTIINVDLPSLKVAAQDLLIAEVTYRRDESGTHADLLLMPPSAFDVEPPSYIDQWRDVKLPDPQKP